MLQKIEATTDRIDKQLKGITREIETIKKITEVKTEKDDVNEEPAAENPDKIHNLADMAENQAIEDLIYNLEIKFLSGTASDLEMQILTYWKNAGKIVDLK